ncbi:hypothetical protein [Amycolatopsis sp. FDAARGOS 1241]|uniref:hypothetical protein n=1 Tax=Amycolatopsis sp. FDAARGOS 1241 TaxID=2778070 RepID=UPI001951DDF1|nr:hypothetical protein [Amycolatopsis sp. FDAARGOS 1241]QRP49152.1 hypothetical protein I6J71_16030 [Amycolatopsis sp. FDAARGOS 1241]
MTDVPDPRPVVFETSADAGPRGPRRGRQVVGALAGAIVAAGAAAGIVWGGSAVWSLVEPGGTAGAPAPLWIPPPSPVTAVATAPSDDTPHTSAATRAPEPGGDDGGDHGSGDSSGRGPDDGGSGRGRGGPGR